MNKQIRAMIWIICTLIFFPSLTMGKDIPSGKWWRNEKIAKKLNLDSSEKEALDQAFLQTRRKLIDLKSAVERERLELDALLDKKTLNEEATMAQYRKMENQRVNLAIENFRFVLQVRKIIGYNRFEDLKKIVEMLRQQRQRRNTDSSK